MGRVGSIEEAGWCSLGKVIKNSLFELSLNESSELVEVDSIFVISAKVEDGTGGRDVYEIGLIPDHFS